MLHPRRERVPNPIGKGEGMNAEAHCLRANLRTMRTIPGSHAESPLPKAGPFCKKHRLGTEHLLDKAGRSRKPPMEMTHICWIEANVMKLHAKPWRLPRDMGGSYGPPLHSSSKSREREFSNP